MNRTIRYGTFLMTAVLVLALSAIAAAPVLADSGPTPPTTGSSNGGRSSHPGSSSNSLSQVPAGTKVVIVDNQGNKLPLGSQAAQDVLDSGDPIWCPSSIAAPTPTVGGCTQTAGSLYDLINGIGTTGFTPPKTSSTIWILSNGTDTSDDTYSTVDINGAAGLSPWASYALTLKGSWEGSGSGAIDPNPADVSQFLVPIVIEHWKNAVTVSDIAISSASGDGLDITTTGNITLTGVQSNNNTDNGAKLDNCEWSGTNCVGTGTVTINASQFYDNNGDGLNVLSKGAVTLNSVTSDSSSNGYGAYIDNCNATTASPNPCTSTAPVTITGANFFDGNYLDGLAVHSNGNISASGLEADSNSQGFAGPNWKSTGGVSLENDFSGSAGTVTITGNDSFTNNYEDGLDVYSNGAITVSGLTATGNGQQGNPPQSSPWVGVELSNSSAPTAQIITISGTNDFEDNFNDGLDASASGLLTASGITANGNGTSVGTSSYLQGGVGAKLQGAKGVILSNSSFDSNNSTVIFNGGVPSNLGGLTIRSSGTIKVTGVTATNDVSGDGALIDNCLNKNGTGCTAAASTVTLTGLSTFTNNDMDGLDVYSFGNIVAADLNASGNDADGSLTSGAGVWLENDYANYNNTSQKSKGTVTMTGTDLLNDNTLDGLDVYSNGTIKAGNIHAINNSNEGAHLDNSSAATAQSVTLTNYNAFNFNGNEGLFIRSKGAITLSTLNVSDNGSTGADILNAYKGFSSGVTLTGNDGFNNNFLDGLHVMSNGAISVTTTTLAALCDGASGYSGSGINLNNNGGKAKPVTLSGTSVFKGNYSQSLDGSTQIQSAGLFITSNGSITVNNVTADFGEDGAGAYLDNSSGLPSATVTVTGFGAFNDNSGDGLVINSKGNVTLTKIIADNNSGDSGVFYQGEGLNVTTAGKVTLTCGEFAENADYGIDLTLGGTATINGATLIDNQSGDNVEHTGGSVLPLVRNCSLP